MYSRARFGGKSLTEMYQTAKSKIAPSASEKLAASQAKQDALQKKIDSQTAKAKADLMNQVKSKKSKMCSAYRDLWDTVDSKLNRNTLFRSDQDVLEFNKNISDMKVVCSGYSFGKRRRSRKSSKRSKNSEIKYLRSFI
jgi:hypothetical protein